jgi:hypothetical protein
VCVIDVGAHVNGKGTRVIDRGTHPLLVYMTWLITRVIDVGAHVNGKGTLVIDMCTHPFTWVPLSSKLVPMSWI